ncbi:MAG: hypothetical protein Q7S16_02345 [bacterium]|nr:hypothetical protein [bacterium]
MNYIRQIIHDVFVVALVTFIVYFFADLLKPGFVTNYINLNMLLLFVIASGIATILLTGDGK